MGLSSRPVCLIIMFRVTKLSSSHSNIFRYLEDLYTLTYQEDSSIDQDENDINELETNNNVKLTTGLQSLQVNFRNIYQLSTVTL